MELGTRVRKCKEVKGSTFDHYILQKARLSKPGNVINL